MTRDFVARARAPKQIRRRVGGFRRGRITLLAMTVLAVVAPGGSGVNALEDLPLIVCTSGPPACDYTSIQRAVDAAGVGATVLVRPGIYTELVSIGVARLTLCSTSAVGVTCDPHASDTIIRTPAGAGPSRAAVTVSAPGARVAGFTLGAGSAGGAASALVASKGVILRDNVLRGKVRLDAGLRDTLVDARLNEWGLGSWRALPGGIDDRGRGNRVLQLPYRLVSGRAEPPLPRVGGSAMHSNTPGNCNNWDANGDGFADSFHDGSACRYLMVQAAIDFSHPGTVGSPQTIVLGASANTIDPTPWFEVLRIDVNNHGGSLVGGGTISGTPQELDYLTLCSAPNPGSNAEPPLPEQGGACATGTDAALARQGVIIEGGSSPLGGSPSGDVVVDIGAVANNATLQNLTIQWSGSPDSDFAPSSDVTAVRVGGADATVEGNMVRLQGGGCTAADLVGGSCYSPASTTGIRSSASASGLRVTGNVIRADMPNPNDGSIGGTNAFFGSAPGGLVQMNLFTGWAAVAAIPFGPGMQVRSNGFLTNGDGLGICPSGSGAPIVADGNVFVGHFTGIVFHNGCGTAANTAVQNNGLGPTNQTSLGILATAGAGTVPAECNDWGVYDASLIPNRIQDARPGGLDVDYQPFRSPSAAGGPLACLVPPFARFGTDLSTQNSENQTITPDTTRYHTIAFTDLSTPGDKPIVSRMWSFGTEGMSTAQNPTFRFPTTGLKTVTLLVRDADGMTGLASFRINVTSCSTDGGLAKVRLLNASDAVVGDFCSIQDAVDAAGTNHSVVVPADTYFEAVTIPSAKTGLTMRGAQVGQDARTRTGAAESVIESACGPLRLGAENVVVDGFTIQGSTMSDPCFISGIWTNPSFFGNSGGFNIRNNIVRNNIHGLYLNGTGNPSVVSFNRFESNNNAGPASGNGIYSDLGLGNATIDRNRFVGHNNTSILLTGPAPAGVVISGNEFRGSLTAVGLPVGGSNLLIAGNGFNDQPTGISIGGQVTAMRVRDNRFPLETQRALRIGAAVTGAKIDARLNDWGVYEWRKLAGRVVDETAPPDNKVLQIPFRFADGTPEPGLPVSSPASHSGNPSLCNGHDADGDGVPDSEYVDGACRFLTVQAAINFSHANGTVTVPMSQNIEDPTPRFETLTVHKNNEAMPETLSGLTLCSTLPREAHCAGDIVHGNWLVQGSAAWAPAPAGGSGKAVRVETAGGQGFGSIGLTAPPDLQISEITSLEFDALFESGGCGGGSPRFTLRVDTDGNGSSDGSVFVYAGPIPSFTGCPTGKWLHEQLVDGSARWSSQAFGGPFYGTQAQANAAAEAHHPNATPHRITSIFFDWDSPWFFPDATEVSWFDNVRFNNIVLMEPTNSACTGDPFDPVCPRGIEVGATIIDAAGLGAPALTIKAPDVTADGFRMRGSSPLIRAGATPSIGGPVIRANLLDQILNPAAASAGMAINGTSNAVVERNRVNGNLYPGSVAINIDASGSPDVIRNDIRSAGTAIRLGTSTSGLVERNTVTIPPKSTFGADSLGISLFQGSGHRTHQNLLQGAGTGLLLAGTTGATSDDDTFDGYTQAIKVGGANAFVLSAEFRSGAVGLLLDAAVNGTTLRQSRCSLDTPMCVGSSAGVIGRTVDARLNDWSVYTDTLVQGRFTAPGNTVLYKPFLTP